MSLEQKIKGLLLSNECDLLTLISQSSISGESALRLSKSILFLFGINENTRKRNVALELFLQRLIIIKITLFRKTKFLKA
jgi:hypothetical protein